MSPDPNDAYFADGMTEEVISTISKIPSLIVISRTSAMKYRNTNKDAREIGRELGVAKILEGSVRKSGTRLRITTQLIDTTTDQHLWSESYDREMEDVFSIQKGVAENVADALKLKLLDSDRKLLGKRSTTNPEAYVFYVRGLYFLQKYNGPDYRKAEELFQKAIDLDPEYAAAIARLAYCYCGLGYFGFEPPREAYPKAKELALRALKLDDTIPEAHFAMGRVAFFDAHWETSRAELTRALELNPSYSEAHTYYALFLANFGHHEDAIDEARKGAELNPLSPASRAHVGTALSLCGLNELAISEYEKALEMDPDFPFIHSDIGLSQVFLGRFDEGVRSLERATELSGRSPFCLSNLGFAYAKAGRSQDASKILDELLEMRAKRDINGLFLAQVFAAIGKNAEALDWLEKSYEEHTVIGDPLLNIDPGFASFHGEPRFRSLVAKLALQMPEDNPEQFRRKLPEIFLRGKYAR